MGYFIYVLTVMLLVPFLLSFFEIVISKKNNRMIEIAGKWFIFWAIGVRLLTAGISQTFNPSFTAGILNINSTGIIVIQELGIANIIFGILGIISLFNSNYRISATGGGIFLGIAGLMHLFRLSGEISFKESVAMISDLLILIVVIVYLFDYFVIKIQSKKP